MELSAVDPIGIASHSLSGLSREGLIGTWIIGLRRHMGRDRRRVNRVRVCGRTTLAGLELYLSAHGRGEIVASVFPQVRRSVTCARLRSRLESAMGTRFGRAPARAVCTSRSVGSRTHRRTTSAQGERPITRPAAAHARLRMDPHDGGSAITGIEGCLAISAARRVTASLSGARLVPQRAP